MISRSNSSNNSTNDNQAFLDEIPRKLKKLLTIITGINQKLSTLKKSGMTEIELDKNVSDIIKTEQTVLSAQKKLKEIAGNNEQLIKKSLERYHNDNNTSHFNFESIKSFQFEQEFKEKGGHKCVEEDYNRYFGENCKGLYRWHWSDLF